VKITIIAFGTRGDVQPLVALGRALQAGGHRVCMVAGSDFRGWIEQQGVTAAETTVDIHAVMGSDAATEWVRHGTDPFVNMRVVREMYVRHGRAMMLDSWRGCQGADVIISSMLSFVFAVSIAARLDARHISAWLQPSMVATRSGAATFNAPLPRRSSVINYVFGKLLIEPFLWRMCGDVANRFRIETLGLPPQSQAENRAARNHVMVLHGYSRFVIPHPADWPANLHTTGYWFLPESDGWQPSPELRRFIESGSPPVYIGFGSMTGHDAGDLIRLFVQAITANNERAIILSGWAGVTASDLPETILSLDNVPHEWLFSRMKAVVHHGGAGTTAASLRAGVPTVVVPHLADQVYWGSRVHALRVGPKPIVRDQLTAPALAAAIRKATSDPQMRQRAADLGSRIRQEDGTAVAIDLINQATR
jgi:sterol 3beta-glucosyltransferase